MSIAAFRNLRLRRCLSVAALFAVVTAHGAAELVADPPGRVAAYFLELPESVTDVLVAEADTATMYRFMRDRKTAKQRDRRYMSIGKNGIGKQRAWDKKTPLGVYFITERLDTSKLHDKYGVEAFPLDYPNAWDRYNKRTGDGIWLHGVDHKNPNRPPRDTDGCLSLPNQEISLLADNIEPTITPVVIARKLEWSTPEELQERRLEFRLALDMWQQSLEAGDINAYLALYADDFSYHDLDRNDWAAWRRNVFVNKTIRSLEIQDLLLVADPEIENLYLSRFTQVERTSDATVTTIKRLYWRRDENRSWRIVAEGAG